MKAKGVDTIACLSVNDAFVMKAWGESVGAGGKVTMLADGNCEFTMAAGLQSDKSASGLGMRSDRYAMIIEDGVVKAIFVEQPKQLEVSTAEHLLSQL